MLGATMSRDYEPLTNAVPLFRALTPTEMDEIVRISRMVKADAGKVIVQEGEDGRGMFVVVHGRAQARIRLFQGDDTHLATIEKGDVIGELSLIDGQPTSATVTAVEDSVLYFIERTAFLELRDKLRPAAFKVLRAIAPMICERLRAINSRMEDMFSEPERHLRIMEKRYRVLAADGAVDDAPARGA